MIARIIHLLTSDTALVAEHAAAYAELAVAETAEAASVFRKRLYLRAVALILAALGVSSVVTAALIAAAIPFAAMPAPWLLLALPLLLCVAAIAFWFHARRLAMPTPFVELRRQLAEDASLLRQTGAQS